MRFTTGLVHDASVRLAHQSRIEWPDRAHFLALAAVAMRHELVDRARAHRALKRDGGWNRVTLDDELIAISEQPDGMLQLSEAIEQLAVVEPRLARVVDCRFFGGMADAEIAQALDITPRTVQRDWLKARMLLRQRALGALVVECARDMPLLEGVSASRFGDLAEAGADVIAIGRHGGTRKQSGEKLDAQFFHVFRFEGDRIVSFHQYADTAQLARLLS